MIRTAMPARWFLFVFIPESERLHICFLKKVVGVVTVAGCTKGEIEQNIHMRNRFRLEIGLPLLKSF